MLNFGLSNLNLSSIVGSQSFIIANQQNPLLIGEMSPMFPTNNQGLQEAAEWGALLMDKQKLTNQVGYLAGFDSQIKSILKSDKLDESQKQRLQDVLDQVKALKEKAQKMLAKQDLKSEEIEALLGEIEELKENASEVAKEVLEEVQAAAEEAEADGAGDADDADGTDDADGADGADGADDADDDTADAKDPDKSADEAVAAEFDKKQKEKENEAAEICQNIYSGSIGDTWGTNYDTIKKGTDKITKDNVTTVLNMWTSQYKQNTNDVNLIETLFNEESLWNPGLADDNPEPGHKVNTVNGNLDIIWNIIVALDERAQELGIKNKIAGLFAVCYDELDDFNVDQDAVINSVTKITEAVTKAEAQQTKKDMATAKENKVKADAAKKKADKAKADAKKAQEQKNEFRNDMREILGDDKAEISENVKYENKKFVIRINGKNYYGKDYAELANALEKDGLDPERYLKQRSLNAVA